MICTECGHKMRLTSEPIIENYRGKSFTIEGISRHVCDCCGNDVMEIREADRLAKMLADTYAHEEGLLSPREIREARKSVGLKQKEFEKLLGVSTPTVSRWETGAMVQTKIADNLIRVVSSIPAAATLLKRRATRTETASQSITMPIKTWKKNGDGAPTNDIATVPVTEGGIAA